MSKYPNPELDIPSEEDIRRVAEEIAKHLSPRKAVELPDGTQVQGTRKQLDKLGEKKD